MYQCVPFLAYYLNSYYTGKLLKYLIGEQIMDVLPMLGLAVVMGAGVYAVGLIPLNLTVVRLALQIVTGALLYTGLCQVFKIAAFREVVEMMKLGWVKLCRIG